MSAAALVAGWRAQLALEFEAAAGRTRLARRKHLGPLLVQRAFYPESALTRGAPAAGVPTEGARAGGAVPERAEPCHLYIIHPPGGVASGDELELDVAVARGAHALLTTPAAGKFYRRGTAGPARVRQTLQVAGGTLEWLPQENIFYPDADVELRTIVQLSDAARFIGWEIGCLGLPASGRTLAGGSLRLGLELHDQGRPILLERLALGGEAAAARWGLAGHSALGTALAYPADGAALECARLSSAEYAGRAEHASGAAHDCAELTIACTLVDGVLVCRALARRADRLQAAFVHMWRALRPLLLGREAVPPRIWKT